MSSINFRESNGRVYIPLDLGIYIDVGINAHNSLTAIFYKIFGSGVIECTDKGCKSYLLNRNSMINWMKLSSLYSGVKDSSLLQTNNKLRNKKISDEDLKKYFYEIINKTTKA